MSSYAPSSRPSTTTYHFSDRLTETQVACRDGSQAAAVRTEQKRGGDAFQRLVLWTLGPVAQHHFLVAAADDASYVPSTGGRDEPISGRTERGFPNHPACRCAFLSE